MKNNLCDKTFIESSDMHNFFCELAWLTQVHSIFLIKCYFHDFTLQYRVNSKLSFSFFFKIIPMSFVSQLKLTRVD
jgi:hypothetical protein